MFWERLVFAIGAMSFAYVLSESTGYAVKKLDQYGKFKLLIYILFIIHYFSAMASLFVGLFMHLQKENTEALHRRIEDLNQSLRKAQSQIESLKEQIENERYIHYDETLKQGAKSGYRQGFKDGFLSCYEGNDLPPDCKWQSLMDAISLSEGPHEIHNDIL